MTRAALYLRVSLDSTGEQLAVTRQREDCRRIARERGWTVTDEYVDNSVSASDARKVRPGYDRLVSDFEAGRFDALVCWDLDRLTRQPRQLEDWIDRAEHHGLKLVTANGDADLTTDGGIMYAGIKVQVARAEVRRKSARQKRANRQRAELGRVPTGHRLTGYTADGQIVEAEAATVRRIFDLFTAGDSLMGIARGLDADGVAPRRGDRWSPSSVKNALTNPRYAGRSTYHGEDVGAATWPPIVSEDQFAAAAARLDEPGRTVSNYTRARKHVGSGVYRCTCGLPMRAGSMTVSSGAHSYACRDRCYYRSGRPVDEYVLAVVRARLAQPDLADLLARPADAAEVDGLTAERADLRHRLAAVEHDYDEGLIDGRRYRAATEKVTAQLEEVQRRIGALMTTTAGAGILAAPDPVEAFDAAPLALRQRLIETLATVTLHRGVRGSKVFRPETVEITWNS